jgi:hypothetical protein
VSAGEIKPALHGIADDVDTTAATLRSASQSLTLLAIELGEMLRGGNPGTDGQTALFNLRRLPQRWLDEAAAFASSSADLVRNSAKRL